MSEFSNNPYMLVPQELQKKNETKLSLHSSKPLSQVSTDFSPANFTSATKSKNLVEVSDQTKLHIKKIEGNDN